MSITKDAVKRMTMEHDIVIFSKSCCPYCAKAKKIFTDLDMPYKSIELDKRDDADQIQDILKELTGFRTVPNIFIYGNSIGGCSDLQKIPNIPDLKDKLSEK